MSGTRRGKWRLPAICVLVLALVAIWLFRSQVEAPTVVEPVGPRVSEPAPSPPIEPIPPQAEEGESDTQEVSILDLLAALGPPTESSDQSDTAADDKGAIRGIVKDARTYQPIEGAVAEVGVSTSGGFGFGQVTNISTTTDEQGEFLLEAIVPGEHRVDVHHDDYVHTTSERARVYARAVTPPVQILMKEAGKIQGKVTKNGKPSSKATINVFKSDSRTLAKREETDETGHYMITGIEEGAHQIGVTVTAPHGNDSMVSEVQVVRGKTVTKDFDIWVGSGAVEGYVMAEGSPVAEVRMYVIPHNPAVGGRSERSTKTDGKGYYLLDELDAGDYDLSAQANQAGTATVRQITVPYNQKIQEDFFQFGGSAAIEGFVFLDGVPMESASVVAISGTWDTFTSGHARVDEEGFYEIDNLVSGEFRLLLVDEKAAGAGTGIIQVTQGIQISPGERFRNDIDVVSERLGLLVGQVALPEGTRGAQIFILEEDSPPFDIPGTRLRVTDFVPYLVGIGITSNDGFYEISRIPPGTYQVLTGSDDGSAISVIGSAMVTITAGEETVLDFDDLE